MKTILFTVLALSCFVVQAAVYRCPQTYPEKDAAPEALTGGYMMWGDRSSNGLPFPSGWESPREEAVAEGTDLHYILPEDEQSWLICQYGARKRVKGRLREGQERGQYMEGGGKHTWLLKLAPKVSQCTVQVREIKSHTPSRSTWTVTAVCEKHYPLVLINTLLRSKNGCDQLRGAFCPLLLKGTNWPSPVLTDTSDRYDVTIGGNACHVKEGCFQKSLSAKRSD